MTNGCIIDRHAIRTEEDVLAALSLLRREIRAQGFAEMQAQMILVSASELCRNIIRHAHGCGDFSCRDLPAGIEMMAADRGPGIAATRDWAGDHKGWRGLGLGLAGVKRLMDEVDIATSREGTVVIARKYKSNRARG